MNDAQRFWQPETREELETVRRVLARRFPDIVNRLGTALEQVDPLDIVYPGNPGEYEDVVWEFLVLVPPTTVDLDQVPASQIESALRTSFRRCFDEPIEDTKLSETLKALRS